MPIVYWFWMYDFLVIHLVKLIKRLILMVMSYVILGIWRNQEGESAASIIVSNFVVSRKCSVQSCAKYLAFPFYYAFSRSYKKFIAYAFQLIRCILTILNLTKIPYTRLSGVVLYFKSYTHVRKNLFQAYI